MNAAQARKLAVTAINSISQPGEHEPVADTTIVGMDSNGYWVTDNGEEVNHLTRDKAIDIIVENLTA